MSAGVPGRRAGAWASASSPPARPPGPTSRIIERMLGLGRHAVRPVRGRLYRAQRRNRARQDAEDRRGVVAGRAAGPARRVDRRGLAEPARTTGCGTRCTRAGRSPRTRSTPRWSRPPATCRSPLSAEDYIELLPATWRVINAYGIKISRRTYDGAGAEPAPAASIPGSTAQQGPAGRSTTTPTTSPGSGSATTTNGGWITVLWTQLRTAPGPVRGAGLGPRPGAARPPRQRSGHRGRDRPAPWQPCWTGPGTGPAASAAGRNARTGRQPPGPGGSPPATARPSWPRPGQASGTRAAAAGRAARTTTSPRRVIPLAFFDAREEAKKWW